MLHASCMLLHARTLAVRWLIHAVLYAVCCIVHTSMMARCGRVALWARGDPRPKLSTPYIGLYM